MKLFIGQAHCTNCHHGLLFTNNDFHNTGIPSATDWPDDVGRSKGVPLSLRNVAERGPYMHAGQSATLEEILHHHNTAPAAPAGQSELEPLNLGEEQITHRVDSWPSASSSARPQAAYRIARSHPHPQFCGDQPREQQNCEDCNMHLSLIWLTTDLTACFVGKP